MRKSQHTNPNTGGATYKTGKVSAQKVDGRVRVIFEELDDLETDWLHVLHHKTSQDKTYWMPDLGEQVACLLDANLEQGCVLGAIYSERDAPPVQSLDKHHIKYKDGTILEYDRAAHKLTVDCVGEIVVKAANKVTIESPDVIVQCQTATITALSSVTATTPTYTINGNLVVNGMATISVDAKIGGISFLQHKHGGVLPGPAMTSPPV